MSEVAQPASRREFLVGGVLAGTVAATGLMARAGAADPTAPVQLDREVPKEIGGWRHVPGSSLLIPQGEAGTEAVYDQLVSRHYASPMLPGVMLLIAHGQAQGGNTQLHRPEHCYPAAGFEIVERPDLLLPAPGNRPLRARCLTGVAPGRTEQILYWTRVGRDFPSTGLAQRWSVLRQTLSSGMPDGILVRLSTIEPNPTAGILTLRRFALSLSKASGSGLQRLLWG